MTMNDEELRMECLRLALGANDEYSYVERARAYADFVRPARKDQTPAVMAFDEPALARSEGRG